MARSRPRSETTLSKPQRRRHRGRSKLNDLMGRTIAKHVCFLILCILSRPLQNNSMKSPNFVWPQDGNSDGKLLKVIQLFRERLSEKMTKMQSAISNGYLGIRRSVNFYRSNK